jgi:hypothetical protein
MKQIKANNDHGFRLLSLKKYFEPAFFAFS